jgi:hypothetical protein
MIAAAGDPGVRGLIGAIAGVEAPPDVSPAVSAAEGFADALRRASRGRPGQTREAAEQLVATAFIAPVLRQLREFSDAAPPFKQTQAEKQFGQLLDMRTAEQIVRRADLPIVRQITATLETRAAASGGRSPSIGEVLA